MKARERPDRDERHCARRTPEASEAPEPSVLEALELMPRGLALDVAAGRGRNSLALARAGLRVVALDYSEPALRALGAAARAARLPIWPVLADLERAALPLRPGSFDAVINVNFLDRALVAQLAQALKVGGLLLFDTFLVEQAALGHPRDPRFLLEHGELRALLGGLALLRYREGLVSYPDGRRAWRATALAARTA